ncbi:MAG: prolipoprotein diacylglyceryl transferase [Chloroflexi bacterium]|nr:prolipoprotein diacylglyceryl transferase [Chloroflexota bacterium]
MTNWFDPGTDGGPYRATVRLTGHRIGVSSHGTGRDTFVHEEAVNDIVPGSGPTSITSWIYGLQPGEWVVVADPLRPEGHGRCDRLGRRRSERPLLRPATWSWRRWAVGTAPQAPLRTRWALPAPLARIPAVVPGSWPVLGLLAVLTALLTQAVILGHERIPGGPAFAASAVGVGLGLIGAKVWYAVLHPGPMRQAVLGGWAVDGFLVVTFPVVAVTLIATGMPVGTVLDATAPGLFLAVAIGRVGCFLTGCCAGRLTQSRFGIWSSDRRIGGRRIPAQLVEAVAGLVLAIATWVMIHARIPGVDGASFVFAMAVYGVLRQIVLRLRAERREFSWRRGAAATG